MRMYDIIIKKRDGGILTNDEIEFLVNGFTNEIIPDYQMASWLMAVYYSGMTKEETVNLTVAMAKSGDMLDLSGIEGVKVDKHSTGGVGDKITLIVTPILAALGVPIAKMSGRGLGHTGGTVDKLESIKGFNVSLSEEEFINAVNTHKVSVVGQTGNLAPADKKIYALRDVTATVDSIPLIASSIMSKKLAAGADIIVLDIKCGSGAFMRDFDLAKELTKAMVDIGVMAGKKTIGVITDMNEPLGCMVGNALEVIEAINILNGIGTTTDVANKGINKILDISLTIAAYMYIGSGKTDDYEAAREKCISVIEDKSALNKFAEFVEAQGGDKEYIFNTNNFPKAKHIVPVYMDKKGYITECDAKEVGNASLILGAGRTTKDSEIDLLVGIDIRKHIGDYIDTDEVFAYIHANNEDVIESAREKLVSAYIIEDEYKKPAPNIKDIVVGSVDN